MEVRSFFAPLWIPRNKDEGSLGSKRLENRLRHLRLQSVDQVLSRLPYDQIHNRGEV